MHDADAIEIDVSSRQACHMTSDVPPPIPSASGDPDSVGRAPPAVRPFVDARASSDSGIRWSDFPVVKAHLGTLIAGDSNGTWIDRLRQATGNRTFRRALVLACGDGRLDRQLSDLGVFESAVGLDASDELLAIARAEAGPRRLQYVRCDLNLDVPPGSGFDLVVCHGAASRIACLHHAFSAISRVLEPDGWLVGIDYTGADRNQYPFAQWQAASRTNLELPAPYRSRMRYPHLPTMLVTDPSEAVHSASIEPTLHQHFEVTELRRLGGAIAYPLLTHNDALFNADPLERDYWSTQAVRADVEHLKQSPQHNLLSFFLARRKPPPPDLADLLAQERARERAAAEHGGHYNPPTEFQERMWKLAEATPLPQEHADLLRLAPDARLRLGSDAGLHLGPDWHPPESWGCWAAVERAHLVLQDPGASATAPWLALLCMAPPTRSPRPTPLRIWVNDHPVGMHGISPSVPQEIKIPLGAAAAGRHVLITLALPRTYVPRDESEIDDTRHLGIGVFAVELIVGA